MTRRLIMISILSFLLLLMACSNDETDTDAASEDNEGTPEQITFGASSVGGFWYTLAAAFGEEMQNIYPGSTISVVEGGSISNLMGLDDGTFTIAFTSGPFIRAGESGAEPFVEEITNTSTVATLYPTDFHLVVREDSDIYEIEDLEGKTVSPGIKGYGGELMFLDILEAKDMSYDDLGGIEYIGTQDAADLLRDSHIDAIAGILAVPNATIQELDTSIGIRLIPIDEETIEELQNVNEGYIPNVIEGGNYSSLEEDIPTIAPFTTLVVNNNLMNEDNVCELTKMLFEERQQWENLSPSMNNFTVEYSVNNNIGELHPGAEKYYEEVGALD